MFKLPNDYMPRREPNILPGSSTTFMFPSSMVLGTQFLNLNEALDQMNREIDSKNLPIGLDSYRKKYQPNSATWKKLTMACKTCEASMTFQLNGEVVTLTEIAATHTHDGKQKKKPTQNKKQHKSRLGNTKSRTSLKSRKQETTEEDLSISGIKKPQFRQINEHLPTKEFEGLESIVLQRPPFGEAQERKEISMMKPLSKVSEAASEPKLQGGLERPRSPDPGMKNHEKKESPIDLLKLLEHPSSYEMLDRWLTEHNYNISVGWKSGSDKQQYPEVLIWVSPHMKRCYDQYGDLLYFEILHDLIRGTLDDGREYRVGVFSVVDSDVRMRLVGISAFVEQTSQCIGMVFQQTLMILGKSPRSIVTDSQKEIRQGLKIVSQGGKFEFEHLLNPFHLLEAVSKKLKGSKMENSKTLYELQRAMTTRDVEEHQTIVAGLLKRNVSRNILSKLLHRKHTSFYCRSGAAFQGLGNRAGGRQVIDVFRKNFPIRMSLRKFVEAVHELDKNLEKKSATPSESYPIEPTLQLESRFLELRQHYGSEAVRCFVENYITGIRDCSVIERPFDRAEDVMVVNTKHDSKYIVENGKCECKEFERTGVACSHLIMVTTINGGKPFTDLISNRWRRSGSAKL